MVQSIYILSMPHELSIFKMTASGEVVDHAIGRYHQYSQCRKESDTLEGQRYYSVSKQAQNWMEDVQENGGSKVEGAGPQIQTEVRRSAWPLESVMKLQIFTEMFLLETCMSFIFETERRQTTET